MRRIIKVWFFISILIFLMYIIWACYRYLNPEIHIFKSKKYNLKIIKEGTFGDDWISQNSFYYIDYVLKEDKNINEKKQSIIYEIGCSKLEKVGFDEKKGIFYGKLDFHSGVVSFRKNETDIKKLCSGYFILDLNTVGYESRMTEKKFEEKLLERGIRNDIIDTKKFVKKYGRLVYCLKISNSAQCDLPNWMFR
ncbi:hypothetical protein [Pseudoleptotrichia goodfellowii]|uniref:Uncharacterized protein n=1 Tax=Pseudoleptotrichia goodfellowii F0264 TaxID=596323 RepID=D0GKF2_9FUSO|nr:hypothetical protein [Pseudoleptotrichia goodfellowii]EEY35434.1 hypothetical protein HMPREF0554_2259 [Pseudoleptotrichia goodfellowii F0264]